MNLAYFALWIAAPELVVALAVAYALRHGGKAERWGVVGLAVSWTIYSVMLEPDGRRVVRRGPGGGVIPFPNMLQSIHCIYTAGRTNTEWSIRHGVLELIRLNYEMSQQMGGLAAAMTDEEAPAGPKVGFYVPGRVRELFGPRKRFPRIA